MRNGECSAGLFYRNDGTIQNLKITNISIDLDRSYASEFYIGGVAGQNFGNIINCEISGNINSDNTNASVNYIGGICGSSGGRYYKAMFKFY